MDPFANRIGRVTPVDERKSLFIAGEAFSEGLMGIRLSAFPFGGGREGVPRLDGGLTRLTLDKKEAACLFLVCVIMPVKTSLSLLDGSPPNENPYALEEMS